MRFRSLLLIVGIALLAGGCRFKSWESFQSATTLNPPGEWKGDKYATSGIANASGGTQTKTSYNTSAKNIGTTNESYDSPAKGSGTVPGEPTMGNRNGQGKNNGAMFTESASDLGQPGNQVIR